jgi:hypothetical protein
MDYGIKISQDGYDVKTCTDQQLVMSSEFDLLKLKITGTTTGTGVVAHGLDYTPIFFANQKVTGTVTRYAPCGGSPWFCTDATNFAYLKDCRYYIFYQQSNT